MDGNIVGALISLVASVLINKLTIGCVIKHCNYLKKKYKKSKDKLFLTKKHILSTEPR